MYYLICLLQISSADFGFLAYSELCVGGWDKGGVMDARPFLYAQWIFSPNCSY